MTGYIGLKEKLVLCYKNNVGSPSVTGTEFLSLTLIVTLGLVLRFYTISSESYWIDEGFSVDLAAKPFLKFIHDLPWDTRYENNPPAYYILLHFWSLLFGLNEMATRSLSALFGITSVILIYYLGKRIYNERVGFISAFLLSISVIHVQYSQEARNYSMLVMMSLLSYLFFVKTLERGGKVLAYLFSSIILVYTNIFGILILLSQALYLFFIRPVHFSNLLKVQLLAGLSFLPWVVLFYSVADFENNRIAVEIFSRPPELGSLYKIMIPFAHFSNILWHQQIGIPCILFFCYLFLFALGRSTFILAVWFMVPFIIVMFLASVPKSILYTTRYFLMALPVFYILCSVGFVKSNRYVQVISMGIILVFTSYNLYLLNTTVKKAQWREVVASISSEYQQNDLVVVNGDAMKVYEYYNDKQFESLRIPRWTKMLEAKRDSLREGIRSHQRLWVIVEDPDIPKSQSLGIQDLFSGYRQVEFKTFHGLQLFLLVSQRRDDEGKG